MALGAALLGLVIVYVVKIAVIVVAARLLLRVYRAAYTRPPGRLWLLLPEEDLPEVRVLWWSLLLFAASELTCGVEVYILLRSSRVLGAAHAFTSAAGMGLFAVGLFAFLDRKLLAWRARGCIGNRLCDGCPALAGKPCRYHALLQLGTTFVALAAIPPLFAPTSDLAAEPRRYLLPFPALNRWFDDSFVPWAQSLVPSYDPSGAAYYIRGSTLVIEYRVLPLVALGLAVVAIATARAGREARAVRLALFAAGVLAYSYFELCLYTVTGDALLGSLGHEVVEFWFLIATAEFLSRTFGARGRPAPAA